MLTREEDVDAHALRRQMWSISAIARHLGRDRKTNRAYLKGERVPENRRQDTDAFVPSRDSCRQRLADDPHLWSTTLFDEVTSLGYQGGYSTFTRGLRRFQVRPHCDPCHASTGRDRAVIDHPAGEEIQFNWLELPDPLPHGVPGRMRICCSGSGRWRTRGAGGRCWPSPRTARIWSWVWTRWCARLVGLPGAGASTGWPSSATPSVAR
jgi:hypothetical protein